MINMIGAVLAILCGLGFIALYAGGLLCVHVYCPAPEFDYG